MSNYNNSSLANDNNLPPLPEIPMPESSNVRLYESGNFDFLTNLNEAGSITRNWLISYERLKNSNPRVS